jgi:hypothetical protein
MPVEESGRFPDAFMVSLGRYRLVKVVASKGPEPADRGVAATRNCPKGLFVPILIAVPPQTVSLRTRPR